MSEPVVLSVVSIESMYMVQVHPQHGRSKLGITDKMMDEVDDSESPLEFWQLRSPTACMIRRPALRIHSGKASALGCERLWSGAKLVFTDNRRSLATERMMQLLNLKCNAHLLDSESTHMGAQALIEKLSTDFDSIFEDVALAEEEEVAARRSSENQEVVAQGSGELSDDMEVQDTGEDAVEPLDLFALE